MSLADYLLSYQTSPIILVNGIAGTGYLPLTSLLSSSNYSQGLLGSTNTEDYSTFFGQFRPLSGHTLMDNEVATYPFANQTVAANAIITNPLRISLEMLVPATGAITVTDKLSIITAIKSALDNHTALGGWYNVATPSYIYQGCLLTSLRDATDEGDGAQVQVRWVWEFMQPLLTISSAQAAQNPDMSTIQNQTVAVGDPPLSIPIFNISKPASNIVQNAVPAAAGPIGSNIASPSSSGVINLSSVSPISPGG